MIRFLLKFRKAVLLAFEHDVVNTAKAAAYSGMLMLFPALLVLTTLLAQVHEGPTLMGEIRPSSSSFCPPTRWICFSPTYLLGASTPAR